MSYEVGSDAVEKFDRNGWPVAKQPSIEGTNTIVEVYGDAKKKYVLICKYIPCKECFDCYAERETVLKLDRKGMENLISELERHIRYQDRQLEEEKIKCL